MDPPASGLKFLLCSVIGPWIPWSPIWHTNTHWVSLAAGLACPQVSWCPSSSQISDLLVSAVSGPDLWSLGSQAFCVASLVWSLPEVTHWHRHPGCVPGLLLPSGVSSTLGPCDPWCTTPAAGIYVSVHGHTEWGFPLTQENSCKCSLTSRWDNLLCSGPGHGEQPYWTVPVPAYIHLAPVSLSPPLPASSCACSFQNHFHGSLSLVLTSVLPLNILHCLLQSQNTLFGISQWVSYPVGSNALLASVRWSREGLSCGLWVCLAPGAWEQLDWGLGSFHLGYCGSSAPHCSFVLFVSVGRSL